MRREKYLGIFWQNTKLFPACTGAIGWLFTTITNHLDFPLPQPTNPFQTNLFNTRKRGKPGHISAAKLEELLQRNTKNTAFSLAKDETNKTLLACVSFAKQHWKTMDQLVRARHCVFVLFQIRTVKVSCFTEYLHHSGTHAYPEYFEGFAEVGPTVETKPPRAVDVVAHDLSLQDINFCRHVDCSWPRARPAVAELCFYFRLNCCLKCFVLLCCCLLSISVGCLSFLVNQLQRGRPS